MRQMRNLLTGILLMLGMLFTTLPVAAQGGEYGRCERNRLRTYWRCLRMAYHYMGKDACYYSVAYYRI